jgi:segregation and condensation protein A
MSAGMMTQEPELEQFRGHPVELPVFQGPLDLLLHLIKRDKIEIWEISISRITRQYLEYLATLQQLNIEIAGDFLVMAATLMRIKSQNLLPRPSFLPTEEDEDQPLTKEELIQRLIEYRKYREAAGTLSKMEWAQIRRHPRGAVVALESGTQLPLREPKLFDLAEYLTEMLARREPVYGHQVHMEEIRLEDQVAWLDGVLDDLELIEPLPTGEGMGVRFDRLLRRPGMRLEVVVTLLAILELARLQRLRVWQRQTLDEIWVSSRGVTPQISETDGGESAL